MIGREASVPECPRTKFFHNPFNQKLCVPTWKANEEMCTKVGFYTKLHFTVLYPKQKINNTEQKIKKPRAENKQPRAENKKPEPKISNPWPKISNPGQKLKTQSRN